MLCSNLNGRRLYSAVLAASVLLASAPLARAGAPPVAVSLATIKIDNFAKVNQAYYRGSQPSGPEYGQLAALGIKTIIDLTSDDAQSDERSLAEAAGLKYVQIPMTTHTAPTAEQIKEFLGLVNDGQQGPVYVHCVGGRHRTGVMTAVYRMVHDGWTADQAFAEMKQYKFGPDFLHSEFKQFVYGYHPEPERPILAAAK